MHKLTLIAGLTQDCFDRFSRESRKRLAPDGHLIAKPVRRPGYDPALTAQYLEEAYNHVIALPEGTAVSISALYVDYGSASTPFLDALYPFALVRALCPIDRLVTQSTNQRNQRLSLYQAHLEGELAALRKRVDVVRYRTKSHNLNPLLLPRANFSGRALEDMIRRLYEELGSTEDADGLIRAELDAFLRIHPRRQPPVSGRHPAGQHCLTDDTLYFRSPGRHRHGHFRPGRDKGHAVTCLLNSRSRLGGAFAHDFHFDCDAVSGRLNRSYPNCHMEEIAPKERHVNIAPSDYVIG